MHAYAGLPLLVPATTGLTFGGAATTRVYDFSHEVTEGGLIFGGIALTEQSIPFTWVVGPEGLVFGGAALVAHNFFVATGQGGIVFNGAATTRLRLAPSPPRPRTPSLYVYPGLGIVEVPTEGTPVLGVGGHKLRGRRWRG